MSANLEEAARGAIHVALKARSFRQTGFQRGAPVYVGPVRSGSRDVTIELIIPDPLMIEQPTVRVVDEQLRARIGAHVNDDGSLCYVTAALEEYDVYNGGGAILRCLENVRDTLSLVLHGNPTPDREREFVSYWKSTLTIQADLPHGYSGSAGLYRRKSKDAGLLVATPASVCAWSGLVDAVPAASVQVIRVEHPLIVSASQPAGNTWSTFRSWLSGFTDVGYLDAGHVAEGGLIAVTAPNGMIAARFEWPVLEAAAFRKAPRARRLAWAQQHPDRLSMKRLDLRSVARLDLVNARLASPSMLSTLKIGVIGCGAVGGRLSLDLVRCGAGGPENPLCLIDPDVLSEANLGRHVLGFEALGTPKVEALAAEARRFQPSISVKAIQTNVLKRLDLLNELDLVVDASGHNPLALALNAHAVAARRRGRFPPLLHASVHGNGLAAQTVLVDGGEHACLKCLRPRHGEFRTDPLAPNVETHSVAATCGDGAFIPYAATAPAIAAALALQATLEWSAAPEGPGPRVRTRLLTSEGTVARKDRSWGKDPTCPACGTVSAGA